MFLFRSLSSGNGDSSTSGVLSVINESLLTSLENETDGEVITLSVVTTEERPYVMMRKGRTGNDAFDGFAIDLLKVRTLLMCRTRNWL